jgi:hypothetical protein
LGQSGRQLSTGPGVDDGYGGLTFSDRNAYTKSIDVELDDDGSVSISWVEKSDDYWGTQERRVRLDTDEFLQIAQAMRLTSSGVAVTRLGPSPG